MRSGDKERHPDMRGCSEDATADTGRLGEPFRTLPSRHDFLNITKTQNLTIQCTKCTILLTGHCLCKRYVILHGRSVSSYPVPGVTNAVVHGGFTDGTSPLQTPTSAYIDLRRKLQCYISGATLMQRNQLKCGNDRRLL